MKIAICDDDQLFTEILRTKIEFIFTAEKVLKMNCVNGNKP